MRTLAVVLAMLVTVAGCQSPLTPSDVGGGMTVGDRAAVHTPECQVQPCSAIKQGSVLFLDEHGQPISQPFSVEGTPVFRHVSMRGTRGVAIEGILLVGVFGVDLDIFQPGDSISLRNVGFVHGTLKFRGQTIPVTSSPLPQAHEGIVYLEQHGTATAPAQAPTAQLIAPFTATGLVTGPESDPFGLGFDGHGRVTVNLTWTDWGDGSGWEVTGVRYDFRP